MKLLFTLPVLAALNLASAPDARAQDAAAAMTAQPATGDYRISETEFERTYGFNDTARAIIHLYYAKWNTGRNIAQFAGAPGSLAVALGRHYDTYPNSYGTVPDYGKYYYDPWVAPVVYSSLAAVVFGLIKAGRHSRRNLYDAIRQYRATRQLPAGLRAASLVPYLTQEAKAGPPIVRPVERPEWNRK